MGKKELIRKLPRASARAFLGNMSESEEWITDGVLLLPRSALAKRMEARYSKPLDDSRPVTGKQCEALWKKCINPPAVASMRGIARYELFGEPYSAMLLSGEGGLPKVFVDAKILALLIATTKANSFRVGKPNTPVALYRDDTPVALLMPMRVSPADVADYDLDGYAVSQDYSPDEGLRGAR